MMIKVMVSGLMAPLLRHFKPFKAVKRNRSITGKYRLSAGLLASVKRTEWHKYTQTHTHTHTHTQREREREKEKERVNTRNNKN